VVLVHPEISISTPWVYKHPDLQKNPEVPKIIADDKLPHFPATSKFRNALYAYNRGDWKELVFNRMESVVFAEYPQLAEYKQRLLDAGCIAAAMSGSGSTIFGICDTGKCPAIENAFKDMKITTCSTSNQPL
jgi:4-diphosphocytidyl-2-C-methyl-D-erythritol kinase